MQKLTHPEPWQLAQILAGVEKPQRDRRSEYLLSEHAIIDRRARAEMYNEKHQQQHNRTQEALRQAEFHREDRAFEEFFDRAYAQAVADMRDPIARRASVLVSRFHRRLKFPFQRSQAINELLEDLLLWHRIEGFLYGCTELEEVCPEGVGWTPQLNFWRVATEFSIKSKWIPKVINPAELRKHPDLLRLTCASWKIFKQSLVMSMYAKAMVTAQCRRITEPECVVRFLYEMIRDDLHICSNSGDSFYNDTGCPNRFLAALSDFLAFDVRRSIPRTPTTSEEPSPIEERT